MNAKAWETEPEEESFEASEMHCVLRRMPNGVWAGYVALPVTHALYRQRRDVRVCVPDAFASRALHTRRVAIADVRGIVPATLAGLSEAPASLLLDVHGGIRFTGMLNDMTDRWYIGFDCGQSWDFIPNDPWIENARGSTDPERADALFRTPADYRTIDYARAELRRLAEQVAALANAQLASDVPPAIAVAGKPGPLHV
jgi:hypothetical protein